MCMYLWVLNKQGKGYDSYYSAGNFQTLVKNNSGHKSKKLDSFENETKVGIADHVNYYLQSSAGLCL